MNGPSPLDPHPMAGFPRVGFLKPLVKCPNVVVGEYTNYDDPEGPEHFEDKCVLYHFPFVGDKLVIGKFCALARGVKFLMNGANHKLSGFSTYPFNILGNGLEAVTPRTVKRRFDDEVVAALLAIRWWDWPVDIITRNLHAIVGADLGLLRGAT